MPMIITRYLGPGNVRGSRVKAIVSSGRHSLTLPWDDRLSVDQNHTAAFEALRAKMEALSPGAWAGGLWTTGEDKDGQRFHVREFRGEGERLIAALWQALRDRPDDNGHYGVMTPELEALAKRVAKVAGRG